MKAISPKSHQEMYKRLDPVFKKSGVKKAILFGSRARGTETRRSDIDLMIIMETDKRFFERFAYFDEIHDVIKGKTIDLLIYTPEELDRISHRPFIKKILNEGQLIYEH